ncbi:MAG TPA: hypothetical protein VK985_14995 [Rariglobus sp.]|nr:hypothetical protein [Rariglobus sp.]
MRLDVTPHDVLSRNVQMLQVPDVVRLRRMSGERDAVPFTPARQRHVIRLVQFHRDRLGISSPVFQRIRLVVEPQRRQVRHEIITQMPVHVREHRHRTRPRAGIARTAERMRLVGENRLHRVSKKFAQLLIKPIVNQLDETFHRARIEQIGRHRLFLSQRDRRIGFVADVVQPAHHRVDLLFVNADALARFARHDGHRLPVRVNRSRVRHRTAHEAACLERRVARHHETARRAARIHAFVVKHHPHPPPPRLGERDAHETEQLVAQPPARTRQSDASMNHKRLHTVRLKIGDLPEQLRLGERVVPKPERTLRELRRRTAPGTGIKAGDIGRTERRVA